VIFSLLFFFFPPSSGCFSLPFPSLLLPDPRTISSGRFRAVPVKSGIQAVKATARFAVSSLFSLPLFPFLVLQRSTFK